MVTYHRASKRTAFEENHNALSTFVTRLERSYEMVTSYRQLLWHYVCRHFMMLTVSTKNRLACQMFDFRYDFQVVTRI